MSEKTWEYAGLPWKKTGNKKCTCLEPMCLDIETSWNHDPDNPITWLASCDVIWGKEYVRFRTPSELVAWLSFQKRSKNLDENHRVLCVIHNAGYDLSYLIPFLRLSFLKEKTVVDPETGEEYSESNEHLLISKEHKIIAYKIDFLEVRDTYILSQSSLAQWAKELNTTHKKAEGSYDYQKIIYQDTEINQTESEYDLMDVLTLRDCVIKNNELHGDDITTMPYTLTGYVRRDLQNAIAGDKEYFNLVGQTRLTPDQYYLVLKSYAGGYTHANRFFKSQVISGKIGHNDFTSHYPSIMRTRPMPVGVPETVNPCFLTIEKILKMYPQYTFFVKIKFNGIRLKGLTSKKDSDITMPFLQFSKIDGKADPKKWSLDNGRVLYTDETFETFLDNRTLAIISEQYEIREYAILAAVRIENGPMPDPIAEVVDRYFKNKSDSKIKMKTIEAIKGPFSNEYLEAQALNVIDKKLLNSTYGCCAQKPVKDGFELTHEMEFKRSKVKSIEDFEEGLLEAKWWLPYQIGVMITAEARYELYEYIKAVGYDHVLYADTDSLFYLKDVKTEKSIEELNAKKHATAPYVVLSNGEKCYYDHFDAEGDLIAFKALHSKSYGMIFEGKNGPDLQVTIAGVPSRTLTELNENGDPVYVRREDELLVEAKGNTFKALDLLADGFEFKINAGVSAVYTFMEPQIIDINGHSIETAGGAIIKKLNSKAISDTLGAYDFDNYLIN